VFFVEPKYRKTILCKTALRRQLQLRTSQEIRRENLKYLIATKYDGVANRMAKDTGISQMQIARVFLKTKNSREVGEVFARRIEKACGLEPGWLDQIHAQGDDIMGRMDMLDVADRKAVEGVIDAMLRKSQELIKD
tara:strand:+ start:75 stop:482 length:408 start_codon:yes stop_codon:yes gene_type:complete